MPDVNFILDFQKQQAYPYSEEINEGILKHLPFCHDKPLRLLDVGAGRGVLGAACRERGYEVHAIEGDIKIAAQARLKVNHMTCADLQDIETIRYHLQGKKFHYIVFSDILEHVFDPLQVLKQYQEFLEIDGYLLISLPNTVNWLSRLRFLLGHFYYEMTGVMDRTHIRFFTFRSARELIKASPYVLERVDCTPFLVRAFLPIIKRAFNPSQTSGQRELLHSPYYQFYDRYIYPIEYRIARLWPSLFAFRMIFVARNREKI